MTFQISTTGQVANKIELLFKDPVLGPKNIKLLRRQNYNDYTVMYMELGEGELSDIFFFGYWANSQNLMHSAADRLKNSTES